MNQGIINSYKNTNKLNNIYNADLCVSIAREKSMQNQGNIHKNTWDPQCSADLLAIQHRN